MRKNILSLSSRFLRFLHEHTISALSILFFAGMLLILGNLFYLAQKTNRDLAIQYAALYIRSLEKVRVQYASQVVSRLDPLDVTITHDYLDNEGAIPIPATFVIGLSESITEPESGVSARLYSDYPFPWREDGGPHDVFETEALVNLRISQEIDEPFIRFEEFNGRYSLRYANAVILEEQCVDCHNTHPDSPKTNWVAGDIRGVQEVIIPMDTSVATIRNGLLSTFGMMLLITLVGIGILALVLNALRSSLRTLSLTNIAYNRFVPHEFLNLLGKENIVDVGLADHVQREMTILFSDIRSFTTISEGMLPEQNFQFINEFLSELGPIVRENDGFIDKYIGDAIMALFDKPNHAVDAAIDFVQQLAVYNQKRQELNLVEIKIGIGLNTGLLMLGTIGENNRMDGTVISDAVNVASRLEGLTKLYGVPLVISEDTYLGLVDRDRYAVRLMDRVTVKGKSDPITVYEVFSGDLPSIYDKKMTMKQDFENAVHLFQLKQFPEAKKLFIKCLAVNAEDKATSMYIERCDNYLKSGWDENWDGVSEITEK